MVLELRTHTGFDGVVAGIVDARRDFVDQHCAVSALKKFHAETADAAHRLDRALRQLRRRARRRHGRFDDVTDVVAVDGLDDRVADDVAAPAARDDHRQFASELAELLDVQRQPVAFEPRPRRRQVRRGADRGVALAVVTVAALFQHAGKTEGAHGLRRRRIGKSRHRQAGGGKGLFLQQFVLHQPHRRHRRKQRMPGLLDRGEGVEIDELVFQRHHISPRGQLPGPGRVVPIADQGERVEALGRELVLSFQHDNFAAERRGGSRGHLGELAAAEDAESGHGSFHAPRL